MDQIRFTQDHEWLRVEGAEAVCGITDYAQKALGDIVYVELPAAGKAFKKGEQAAVVESAKAASEVYAPVDGEVTAVNDALSADPAKINSAAESDGWFFKVRLTNAGQTSELMDKTAYEDYVKGLLAG